MTIATFAMDQSIAGQYRQIHETSPGYGASAFYTDRVVEFARRVGGRTFLDWGCGKGAMTRRLAATQGAENVQGYDFAIPEFTAPPKPADVVACIDVCEHLEPGEVAGTLAGIRALAKKGAFIVISCRPAVKILPDGRNAHLTVQPPEWWRERLRETWGPEWTVSLTKYDEKNRCATFQVQRQSANHIESLEILGRKHFGAGALSLAVVGNGPVPPEDWAHIHRAGFVIRFNDWNRRKNFVDDGGACNMLFTQLDANHDPAKLAKPPEVVGIAIPAPFKIDRIIEMTDLWHRDSAITMFNPYLMRLICRDVLRLESEGHRHPIPTVGFQMLYLLSLFPMAVGVDDVFVTGFSWHLDKEAGTLGRVKIADDHFPAGFNHSYLREGKWVAANLLENPVFRFGAIADDALRFITKTKGEAQ